MSACPSRPTYHPPQLLRDVLLLDLLELTGSTRRASRHLDLSQPSVSRRYLRLARDFGLRRDLRPGRGCRFGSNGSIRHLRLAARAHRIAAGQVALGCDPLHRPLLQGVEGLLLPPPCFLPGVEWSHLLREGVVDAALVPALEREAVVSGTPGIRALELIGVPLALVTPRGTSDPTVLAPPPERAPGLVSLLEAHALVIQSTPRRAYDGNGWLGLLVPEGPRLPVPAPLAEVLQASPPFALERRRPQEDLQQTLWLLLPEDLLGCGLEERILTGLGRSLADRPDG